MLKSLTWQKEDHAEMLLIAVRPDYQGLGVNALFFDDLIPIYNQYGYTWAETGPQLENNLKELTQWKPLKPDFVKRRRCYTKKIKIS
jgi:GNAT superfamily N-acetyltransferase